MPSLDTSIANAALPSLSVAFGASFASLQWIVLAYLLAITALVAAAGRAGDLLGRRRLLLAGILVFTAASLLCGLATSLWFLVAARAAQGLGAALMMALATASAGESVPREKTGSAMGLLGTMSAIGTTLGPTLGGFLMAGPGWRSIFLINVPLGVLTFVLVRRAVPTASAAAAGPRSRPAAGFDVSGILLLTASLSAYALSMTLGHGKFGICNLALLAAAGAGAAAFWRVESRAATPLIATEMFRDPGLRAGLAMSGIVSAVLMSTLVVGPFYLSRALHLDSALAGLALSAGPFAAAIAGIPAGKLVDRFGANRLAVAGLAGIASGCLALFAIPSTPGLPGYLVPILVITSSYALFQTANNTAILSGVGAGQRGVVSGLLSLTRNLGLITGAAVLGALFAYASAGSITAEAVATGMRTTFAASLALVLVALTVAAARFARKSQ